MLGSAARIAAERQHRPISGPAWVRLLYPQVGIDLAMTEGATVFADPDTHHCDAGLPCGGAGLWRPFRRGRLHRWPCPVWPPGTWFRPARWNAFFAPISG